MPPAVINQLNERPIHLVLAKDTSRYLKAGHPWIYKEVRRGALPQAAGGASPGPRGRRLPPSALPAGPARSAAATARPRCQPRPRTTTTTTPPHHTPLPTPRQALVDLPPAKPGSLALVKDKKGAQGRPAEGGPRPGPRHGLPALPASLQQHVLRKALWRCRRPSRTCRHRGPPRHARLAPSRCQSTTCTGRAAPAPRRRAALSRGPPPAFRPPACLHAGEILAKGFYDPKCAIAFRACALKERLDEEGMQRRMLQAIQLRKACVESHETNAFRCAAERAGCPAGQPRLAAGAGRPAGPGRMRPCAAPGPRQGSRGPA
jgi:hypothetical protein